MGSCRERGTNRFVPARVLLAKQKPHRARQLVPARPPTVDAPAERVAQRGAPPATTRVRLGKERLERHVAIAAKVRDQFWNAAARVEFEVEDRTPVASVAQALPPDGARHDAGKDRAQESQPRQAPGAAFCDTERCQPFRESAAPVHAPTLRSCFRGASPFLCCFVH